VHEAQLYECLTTVGRLFVPSAAHAGQSADRPVPPALVTRYSLAEAKARATARVLVAEDNIVNQKVAVRMLEKLGYRVDLAANSLEVLEAIAQINYAAVLMDCQMPEMDGFAATRLIREREQARGNVELGMNKDELNIAASPPSIPHPTFNVQYSRHIPIIALTANALQEDRDRCLEAGMDDFLSKPVQSKLLATMLARWVPPDSPAPVMADRPRDPASGDMVG
jgi:CheY-like chemotaxis protein